MKRCFQLLVLVLFGMENEKVTLILSCPCLVSENTFYSTMKPPSPLCLCLCDSLEERETGNIIYRGGQECREECLPESVGWQLYDIVLERGNKQIHTPKQMSYLFITAHTSTLILVSSLEASWLIANPLYFYMKIMSLSHPSNIYR